MQLTAAYSTSNFRYRRFLTPITRYIVIQVRENTFVDDGVPARVRTTI